MTKTERAILIGNRLRELRGIRPRTKVAKQMGLSYSTLTKFESGERLPSDEAKEIISKYYGVPVGDLFYGFENHEKR